MVKRPTDEETWALKKKWAENPPELLEGTDPLTRHRELLRLLDEVSAGYIMTIAEREHKTPAQVVGDMVQEKITCGIAGNASFSAPLILLNTFAV